MSASSASIRSGLACTREEIPGLAATPAEPGRFAASVCCGNANPHGFDGDRAAKRLSISLSLLTLFAAFLFSDPVLAAVPQNNPVPETSGHLYRMPGFLEIAPRTSAPDGPREIAQIQIRPRRCDYSNTDLGAVRTILRAAGYRTIRYLGSTQITSICTKFVHVTACRGRLRHRVDVQFMRDFGRSDGIAKIAHDGYCLSPRSAPVVPGLRTIDKGGRRF